MLTHLPTDFHDRPIHLKYITDLQWHTGTTRKDGGKFRDVWQAILSKRGDGIFWNLGGTGGMDEAWLERTRGSLQRKAERCGVGENELSLFVTKKEGLTFLWKKQIETCSAGKCGQ